MTWRRLLVAAIGLGAIVFFAAAVHEHEPADDSVEESKPAALPVEVITLEPVTSFEQSRWYTGVIAARRESSIGFERSARVVSLAVDEGDEVAAGDSLATLDTRHLLNRRDEISARRDAAEARLRELVAGPRKQTIEAAEAEVRDLTAQKELQTRNHERSKDLRSRDAIAEQDLDDSQFALDSIVAKLDAAGHRLAELEAGTRVEQLAAQRAVVAELNATLGDIKVDINDSLLKAPFDARIAERFVDEGTVVAPNQPVFRLVEHKDLEARIGLPAASLRKLEQGTATQLQLEVGGHVVEGTLVRSLPEVDRSTRTQVAIFNIDPSNSEVVVPGQIVRARVPERIDSEGFWLPTNALSPGVRGLWSVFAVVTNDDHDVIEERPVEVLHTAGDRVLVAGALTFGDRVVVSGGLRVVHGQVVSVPVSVPVSGSGE